MIWRLSLNTPKRCMKWKWPYVLSSIQIGKMHGQKKTKGHANLP